MIFDATSWHEPPTLRDIGDGFLPRKNKIPWHWKILDGLISCVDPERIPDSGSVIAKAITPIETIKYVGHPGSARDSEGWHEGFTNKIWCFHPNGILDDSTMMNLGLYTTKTPVWSGGLKIFWHPWEWTNWSFFNPNLAVELSACLAAWHESLLTLEPADLRNDDWIWHLHDIEGICLIAGAYLGGPQAVYDPGSWCQLNLNASENKYSKNGLLELGRIPAQVDNI